MNVNNSKGSHFRLKPEFVTRPGNPVSFSAISLISVLVIYAKSVDVVGEGWVESGKHRYSTLATVTARLLGEYVHSEK